MNQNLWTRLAVGVVLSAAFFFAGCAKDSTAGKLPKPFGHKSGDEAMRPYVESGSFPSAKQAGVRSKE